MSASAWCNVCEPPRRLPLTAIGEHLLDEHGIDVDDATRWPDGELVIVDKTLEPEDFE